MAKNKQEENGRITVPGIIAEEEKENSEVHEVPPIIESEMQPERAKSDLTIVRQSTLPQTPYVRIERIKEIDDTIEIISNDYNFLISLSSKISSSIKKILLPELYEISYNTYVLKYPVNSDKEFADILKLVLEVAKNENIRIEGKNRWKKFLENYEEAQKSKRKKNYEVLAV